MYQATYDNGSLSLKINEVEVSLSNVIDTVKLTYDSGTSELACGVVIIPTLEFTLLNTVTCVLMDTVELNVGNIPFHKFIVVSADKQEYITKFKAYVEPYGNLSKGFFGDLEDGYTVRSMLNEISTKTGVTIDGVDSLPNLPLTRGDVTATGDDGTEQTQKGTNYEGKTYLEQLSLISGLLGKNIIFTRDNHIKFTNLNTTDIVLTDLEKPTMKTNSYRVNKIICQTGRDAELVAGSATLSETLSLSNCYMTQEQLNALLTQFQAIKYEAFEFNHAQANLLIEPYDMVSFEYKGQNYVIPVQYLQIVFSAKGANYVIKSFVKQGESAVSEYKGTLTSRVDNVYTEVMQVRQLIANIGQFEEIEAVVAKIDNLYAKVGHIQNLLAGTITSEEINTIHLTSQNAVIDNAIVKSEMIESLAVSKLASGVIDTSKIQIQATNGHMTIADNTIRFIDSNGNTRLYMGEDTNGNFSYQVYNANGSGLLLDENGLKEIAITDGLIKTNMINNQAITGDKINWTSFCESFNSSTNTNTLDSAHITMDGKRLDTAFNQLNTTVNGQAETINTHTSQLTQNANAIQGLVTATTITKENGTTIGLKDEIANMKLTQDSFQVSISERVDNIKIGGNNLISKTSGYTMGYISASNGNVTNEVNNNQDFYTNDYFFVKQGNPVTFTLYPKDGVTSSIQSAVYIHIYNTDKVWQKNVCTNNNVANTVATVTYTAESDCYVRFSSRGYHVYNHMAEFSNKPSEWSPSSIDVTAQITNAKNEAISSSNNTLNSTIANYYTKSQTDSAIKVAKDAINLGVSSTYETKANVETKINGVAIGGTNLLLNSHFEYDRNWAKGTGVTRVREGFDGGYCMKTVGALKETRNFSQGISIAKLEKGQQYTATVWIKTQDVVRGTTNPHLYLFASYSLKTKDTWVGERTLSKAIPDGTTAWTKYVFTFTMPTMDFDIMTVAGYARDFTGTIWWDGIKLEKGNKATDWSPSPLDISTDITNAKTDAINTASTDATNKVNSAKNELNTAIGMKANSADVYTKTQVYTKDETNSQINIAKDAINLGVSQTYETKTDTTTKINNAVNGIKIGGTNLITKKSGYVYGYFREDNGSPYNTGSLNDNQDFYTTEFIFVKNGTSITFTSYPKQGVTSTIQSGVYIHFYNTNKVWQWCASNQTSANAVASKTYTTTADCYVRFCARGFNDYNHMAEFSNKPSEWSPSPKDIDVAINAKANSADVYTKSEVYTKSQTDSAIKVAKDAINLGVSNTYETKTSVETKVNNAVNNIQIGGRNLALGTGKATGDVSSGNYGSPYSATDLFNGITAMKTNTEWSGRSLNLKAIAQRGGFKAGDSLVFSVYIKADKNVTLNVSCHRTKGTGNTGGSAKTYRDFTVTPKWQQVWFPFVADEGSLNREDARIEVNTATGSNYIHWAGWKLEKGTKPSDWTPAPEDTTTDIATAKTEAINTASTDATSKVNSAKTELNTAINKKANSADVYKKSEVYTKSQTDSQINVAKNAITQSVSSTYETKANVQTKIDAISVGGTNLIKESKLFTGIYIGNGWRVEDTGAEGFKKLYINTSETTWKECNVPLYTQINSLTGDVTVSFEYLESTSGLLAFSLGAFKSDGTRVSEITNVYAKDFKVISTALDWKTVSYTFNPTSINGATNATEYRVQFKKVEGKSGEINVRKPQLELGNKATAWSPSPLDVDANMNRLKIDGTNLITKKRDFMYGYLSHTTGAINNTGSTLNANQDFYTSNYFPIKKGESVALASYPKSGVTSGITVGIYIHVYNTSKTWVKCAFKDASANTFASGSYTADADGYVRFSTRGFNDYNHKAVYGKNVGEWSPSPLDIETNVSNLTTRVSTAEQKITDSAITNTVKKNFYTKTETENAITSKGYATSSEVQQTAENITYKFSQSGGYNLVRNGNPKPHNYANWSVSSNGNWYLGRTADIGIQTTDTNEAQASSATFKVQSGVAYSFSCWVMAESNTKGTDVFFIGSANDDKAYTEVHHLYNGSGSGNGQWVNVKKTFTVGSNINYGFVRIDNNGRKDTSTTNSTVVFFSEVQMVKGSECYPQWSPNPNEVYDGVTIIDKNGIKVSATGFGGYTHMTKDGFYLNNGSTDVFKMNGDGLKIGSNPNTSINGDVIRSGNIVSNNSDLTFNLNSGKMYYKYSNNQVGFLGVTDGNSFSLSTSAKGWCMNSDYGSFSSMGAKSASGGNYVPYLTVTSGGVSNYNAGIFLSMPLNYGSATGTNMTVKNALELSAKVDGSGLFNPKISWRGSDVVTGAKLFPRSTGDRIDIYSTGDSSVSNLTIRLADDVHTYFKITCNHYTYGHQAISTFRYVESIDGYGIDFYRGLNMHNYNLGNVALKNAKSVQTASLALLDDVATVQTASPTAMYALDNGIEATQATITQHIATSINKTVTFNGTELVEGTSEYIELPQDFLMCVDIQVTLTPNKLCQFAVTSKDEYGFVIETDTEGVTFDYVVIGTKMDGTLFTGLHEVEPDTCPVNDEEEYVPYTTDNLMLPQELIDKGYTTFADATEEEMEAMKFEQVFGSPVEEEEEVTEDKEVTEEDKEVTKDEVTKDEVVVEEEVTEETQEDIIIENEDDLNGNDTGTIIENY